MVLLLHSLILVCAMSAISAKQYDFMNCPGYQHEGFDRYFKNSQTCCNSSQLPNNCECFDTNSRIVDFTNSAFHLPKCPEDLKVDFTLCIRNRPCKIIRSSRRAVAARKIKLVCSGKPIKFIIHGYQSSTEAEWVKDLKDELLRSASMNVILVDWRDGAAGVYYQAVANVRSTAAMLARLILDILGVNENVSYQDIHIIGHSLGAHLAGNAGQELKRLTVTRTTVGRISGLDPAGPYFQTYENVVKLTSDDADFVDIIHTDAEPLISSGLGTEESTGHVDFFPNGGKHQPGCPAETIFSIFNPEDLYCSHARAALFFKTSINTCNFDAPAGGTGCKMGYHATSTACSGSSVQLNTTSTSPFCET